MMATPGRTTQLQAVNIMLDTIGEQPVNTLEEQQISEARQALTVLEEFHKDGQTRGWSWNTEEQFPFTKGTDGTITVPANLASLVLCEVQEWGTRFVLRGSRIYDRQGHSYVLPTELEVLRANVVWFLGWEECSEAYNRWASIRAARAFAGRILGDAAIPRLVALDEEAALVELERVETDQAQGSWLSRDAAFPSSRPDQGLGRNSGWGPS
jgi:hypothetical protein